MHFYKFFINCIFFQMSDIEETIKRIQSQKGVSGVVIMDTMGLFI